LGNLKSSPYTDININPKNTEEIYLAADSFLYQSTNGGESWNLTAPSPPNQLIYTIAIDTSFGSRMLLGGNLPGIYGLDLLTSFIKIRDQRLPLSMKLHQNYPNPFNPMTTIEYSIPQSGFVSIQVFNLLGQEIETLVNKKQKPGNYSIQFDATNLASGIYLYRIQEGKNSLIKKMVVVK